MGPNFGTFKRTKLRVLDFDIENRPLSYWIPDRPTAEVTAIAWSFIGQAKVECALLTPEPDSMREMLLRFRDVYDEADIVTGHYIRRHDLPILTGAMVENGLEPLPAKLSSDTKLDLIRWKDIPQSQEYLSAMAGLSRPKHSMDQHTWREANRLTAAGILATKTRVVADIHQHKQLREYLLDSDLLGPPQLWSP